MPKLRTVEVYIPSLTRLYGVVLNELGPGITLPLQSARLKLIVSDIHNHCLACSATGFRRSALCYPFYAPVVPQEQQPWESDETHKHSIYLWHYSPLLDLGLFFSFLVLYTVGRTPWTRDQPVIRPLPAHRRAQIQNKFTQTSLPQVGFEPTIPVLKWAKTSRYYRVPKMVYNTQKYWVFGRCPSSGFF
jgi:hypothetical protein